MCTKTSGSPKSNPKVIFKQIHVNTTPPTSSPKRYPKNRSVWKHRKEPLLLLLQQCPETHGVEFGWWWHCLTQFLMNRQLLFSQKYDWSWWNMKISAKSIGVMEEIQGSWDKYQSLSEYECWYTLVHPNTFISQEQYKVIALNMWNHCNIILI